MRISIAGTAYAGEMKKAAFTLGNLLLPEKGLFPMHASATTSEQTGESTVLFGLSGTGKTTLSASPDQLLIGDDEILWTPEGLSNLEGGCYAKLIDLTEEKEPEIYRAVNQKGSILENDKLIQTLETLKKEAAEIGEEVAKSEDTMLEVE